MQKTIARIFSCRTSCPPGGALTPFIPASGEGGAPIKRWRVSEEGCPQRKAGVSLTQKRAGVIIVNKGRCWKHCPITDVHKFTNQGRKGNARRNRQETEQMTLDERGQGEDGGEEKRPWERGVCLLKDVCRLCWKTCHRICFVLCFYYKIYSFFQT